MSYWTLFSNHGHVLVCLARNSDARLRDVAADVGITERAVQKIVRDLQDVGMLSVSKNGRRNSYRIHKNKPLRHELESDRTLKDLIKFVNKGAGRVQVRVDEVRKPDKPVARKNESQVREKKPLQSPAVEIVKEVPVTAKSDTDKSGKAASIERQQRSLF